MITEPPSTSTLTVPSQSPIDGAELFAGLQKLKASCGPNKHDQAIALICACIDNQIVDGAQIVGTLKELGFNAKHVGATLATGTGSAPAGHHWFKDASGLYHNH